MDEEKRVFENEKPIDQEKVNKSLGDFYRDLMKQKADAKKRNRRFLPDGSEIVEDEREG